MKLALAICVALLSVVLVQAEDEMSPTTRVVNGKPAVPQQLPFVAYVTSEDPGTRPCGGSLITRTAVLTSAWCVHEHKKYTVRLGSIYRTKEDRNAWTVVSKWATWHPYYDDEKNFSNVAIIYLPRKAPINDYIQLVDLPSSPDMGSFLYCTGIVSGWGKTSVGSDLSEQLHWTEMIVIPNSICAQIYQAYMVTEGAMCAGSYTSAVYYGDDGNALVLKKPGGRFLQIGMHFYRDWSEFNISKPALYSRLTYFLEWIRKNAMDGYD